MLILDFVLFTLLDFLQMDELACFAPGMLALGSSGYSPNEAQKFLSLAEEVFLTCRASLRNVILGSYLRNDLHMP